MATTYDLTTAPNPAYQVYEGAAPIQRRAHRVDVAVDMPAKTTGDVGKMIALNPGDYVLDVWAQIITPSTTGSSTFTVGDSANNSNWITAASATAAANTTYLANGTNLYTVTTGNLTAFAGGKIYAAADYISFVQGATAAQNGVFEVNALVIPKPFTND